MSELVPQPDEQNGFPTQSSRKPWRTPQFMVSRVLDTQHSSDPPTSDGTPASQLS